LRGRPEQKNAASTDAAFFLPPATPAAARSFRSALAGGVTKADFSIAPTLDSP